MEVTMKLLFLTFLASTFTLLTYPHNALCQREPGRGVMGEPMDEDARRVDPKNSTVWGPGLKPHILTLPARYFYVQLLGHGGKK